MLIASNVKDMGLSQMLEGEVTINIPIDEKTCIEFLDSPYLYVREIKYGEYLKIASTDKTENCGIVWVLTANNHVALRKI